MVKITNTPEEINPKKQNKEEQKLTPELIQQMIKQQDKQDKKETTQLNLRLETSISNQIELQAIQEDTTKTEIIKDILTGFYKNKTLTKGTFNLKEPVTLMIPKNQKLLNEYIEHEINIASSLKFVNGEKYINPLDPQVNLYETDNYDTMILTQCNNLLDSYDPVEKCYYDSNYNKSNEEHRTSIHRGLLIISFEDEDNNLKSVFLRCIIHGNKLTTCHIISENTAIKEAFNTGNGNLYHYIRQLDEYNKVNELVSYNIDYENLWKGFVELKEQCNILLEENSKLKEELEFNQNETISEDTLIKRIYELETENEALTRKLNDYEKRELENNEAIEQIKNMVRNL